jgi:hypothetical protein
MQEMWLFGKLDTLRQEDAEETDLLELVSELVTDGLVKQNQR